MLLKMETPTPFIFLDILENKYLLVPKRTPTVFKALFILILKNLICYLVTVLYVFYFSIKTKSSFVRNVYLSH